MKHLSAKKPVLLLLGVLGLASAQSALAIEIQSLRGENDIKETTEVPEVKRYNKDGQPLPRNYVLQPPLIPHKIDGYQITIKHNKCLSCHSWKNYRRHHATKISQTHFQSRDGIVLANVSARRYFCLQCHVPQTNALPLVENTFEPVESVSAQ
ncbi:MAG: nitrate reductase cytochrome c-type subunit [Gammaproteobacteria bacterium]|nr:MAG: nitrate reductase cytochrome c-type subunit [Gammaproteobacteria bacterium]